MGLGLNNACPGNVKSQQKKMGEKCHKHCRVFSHEVTESRNNWLTLDFIVVV